MRYANIDSFEICNGEGVGVSLFVQGCHFHCPGCFNQAAWDFDGGNEWTNEIEDYFLELINKEYVTRVSILGGEPLEKENIKVLFNLLDKIKKIFNEEKTIWLYTGRIFEEILTEKDMFDIINLCNVIVDGCFKIENKDLTLKYRGSSNQRVIDVKKSLKHGKVITYCE